MARPTKICCYLKNLCQKELSIMLPPDSPIIIGRMPEVQLTDKTCSRNQLELRANYDKRYVLVKRLGSNPSHIEGIEIQKHVSSKLKPGQILYIVNMKYPHAVSFESSDPFGNGLLESAKSNTTESSCIPASINIRDTTRKRTRICSKSQTKPAKESRVQEEYSSSKLHSQYDFSPEKENEKSVKNSVSSSHWSQGLKVSMTNDDLVVIKDELVVAIKDKYPKAKFHWLVLPVAHISHPYQLKTEHVDLVQHMLKIGKRLAEAEMKNDDSLQFRFGYHAVPSMSHLHMHVISQDFCSPSLKTKKHWNSFTTEYFVDAEDIIQELENDGQVKNRKSFSEFLKNPLKCHRCHEPQKNMPTLKKHITSCKKR